MLMDLGLLSAGLLLLMFSADKFVYGASNVARKLGLSPMIIGLTIVAMGSSAPEMFIAAQASLQAKPDTAIGNVLGSNIANICLILGITALIKAIKVDSATLKVELPIMLAASMLAAWLLVDGHFQRHEAYILMAAFIAAMGYLISRALTQRKLDKLADTSPLEPELDLPRSIGWLIFGIVLLPISADLMVDGAVGIAKTFGISDLVIGLTIMAIGTSLPELAASVASVLKGEDDLAIGNVVGSNLFNILAVLAIPGLIAPGAIDAAAASRDNYLMLASAFLLVGLLMLSRQPRSIKRWQGGLLLICFLAYQGVLLSSNTQIS
ncbi:calcium/sodium antiporter [Paraferrimonas sp. SM1919]|uniref:calcium/sodium antiporter n=1 Tax=Paraferrimonas sp. SM1919 TaxID=2662263 RepID=UPI0013D17648|nr:calcium/sodium antiporter [Paraferrimonas sp. SM1919]